MNRLGTLLLAANSLFAADFANGQAARAVIGQPFFTAQLPGPASATYPGNMLLGSVSGLAYANGVLVVADSSPFRVGADPQNNRVLLYYNLFGPGDPNSTTGPTQLPVATAEPVPNNNSPYWWCPVCGGRADVVVGQTDFNGMAYATGASGLRTPTAVATDGVRLAIADTDNNRVLLWNQLPHDNGHAADVVLGQPDFNTVSPNTGTSNVLIPAANTLRGPEGVWIQGSQLFVADSMNNRVLIWNSWPTTNGQAANLVLGQPDFNTQTEGDLTKGTPPASATNMLNPASVSSDGTRLFVSDLGQNRVLVWKSIPAQNQAPADVALGQQDLVTSIPDNAFTTDANGVETAVMCKTSNGTDTNGNPTYPPLCEVTLNLPRFALSDGQRLFVADGGNDRVLIYEPVSALTTGAAASVVIGQADFITDTTTDNTSDTANSQRIASADSIRTPAGLAWDGTNLFVSEAFSRRVLVFAVGASAIAPRNAASMEVFAGGLITLSGTPKAGDVLTVTITPPATATNSTPTAVNYTYTVVTGDTLASVSTGLANAVNSGAGDPDVVGIAVPSDATVTILARVAGIAGNSITLAASSSSGSSTTITSTTIQGGTDASHVAPATLVAIFGQNLTDGDTVTATMDGVHPLPTRLGTAPKSVEVFADGIRMPLLYVSPTQINAQIPYEIAPESSISVYVRTTYANGTVTIANAAALPVALGVPGFFAYSVDTTTGTIYKDPRPAIATHYSDSAMGAVDLELTAVTPNAGDTVSITIGSNTYTYTVQSTDTTLDNVRDNLIALLSTDPTVVAYAGGQWDRMILVGRTAGPSANGVTYSGTNSTTGTVTATALSTTLCCANTRGALVTADNPAQPGEIVTLYAAGLGVTDPAPTGGFVTGAPYSGVFPNKAANFLNNFVSGTFGGKTAQILNASLMPGTVGLYEIDMLLGPDLPADPATQGTVAQQLNVTNIVTIPVCVPGSGGC